MSAKNLSEDQSWTMRRLTAVTAVFLGVALVIIDSTIVNLALPVLAQSLSVSDATSTWLVIAYQMVLVTLLFPSIVLASVLGRRQLFLLGIALFTLASLGCCLAGSFGVLVCFRILQAAGGSAILSVNISLVEQLFPKRQLSRGLGLNTATISLSIILGPLIAGFILVHSSWHWLFAFNIPLGLFTLCAGHLFFPRERIHSTTSLTYSLETLVLAILFFAACFSLLGIFSYGFPAWTALPALLILALSTVFLVRSQRRAPIKLFPDALYARTGFRASMLCLLFCFMAQSGTVLAMPFFFMEFLGFDIADISFLLICWPLLHILASVSSGELTARVSPNVLCLAGMILCALGILSIFLLESPASLAQTAVRVAVCGLGFGLFQAPNDTVTLLWAPSALRTQTSAILAFMRTLGQTLGAMITAGALLWFPDALELSFVLAVFSAVLGIAAILTRSLLRVPEEQA